MTNLLISHTSDLNGAEKSLLDLAIGLKLQNINCLVLCPATGELSTKLEEEKIPVSYMSLPRPQRDLPSLLKFIFLWLPTIISLLYFLHDRGIHLVYNNTIDGLYGPFASRLAGIPCVWHVREVKPLNAQARKLFTWLLVHLPTITVFNSKATMSAYSNRAFSNWRIVYNGVKMNSRPPVTANKPIVLVGFAGQMVAHKCPERFIQAFAIAKKACPHLVGIMAGDGLMLEEMKLLVKEQNISNSLQILGRVKDMVSFYRNLDIFVLTSEKEPFGRVLIEAMSVGCPVIAASVGGVPEVVEDGVTGFLVPSHDINAFAKNILLLARDRDLRIQMGLAGYKRVQDLFSVTQYCNQLVSIFKEVSKSDL